MGADNADQRLTPLGIQYGLVTPSHQQQFEKKKVAIDQALDQLRGLSISPTRLSQILPDVPFRQDGVPRTPADLLRSKGMNMKVLAQVWPELAWIQDEWALCETVEAESFYAKHLAKQERDIAAYKKDLAMKLPDDFPYHELPSLSQEEREKLSKARPSSLAAASRISGITPASLMALHKYLSSSTVRACE